MEAFYDSNYSVAWSVYLTDSGNLGGPAQIAYDSSTGDLYIPSGSPAPPGAIGSSNLSDSVFVLNATSGATVGVVPVGASPEGAAYDDRSATVFVTNARSSNVSAIQGTTPRNTSIPVGGYPVGIAVANGTDEVFVANEDGDTVSILPARAGSGVATVTLGGAPVAVAYDASTETVYAAGGESVELVSDTSHALLATTPVGAFPTALAYDPRNGDLYVANSDNNTVTVVSGTTHRVLTTVSVGSVPDGVAYDNVSREILVACHDSNAIYVVSDATDTVTTIVYLGGTGGYPTGVVYDAATNDVYVSDSSAVSVISGSTWQLTATITSFTSGPLGYPALDTANGNLYVPVYLQGVQVVSTATDSVVASIPLSVGGFPYAAAFDAATGDVFVSDAWRNSVSVLDGADNILVGNLTVGEYPTGVTYDNRTGEIYVADEYSDRLTYIVATAPLPPPLGVVIWVVLGSTMAFGVAGVLVAVWISRRGPPRKLVRPGREPLAPRRGLSSVPRISNGVPAIPPNSGTDYRQSSRISSSGRWYAASSGDCMTTPTKSARYPLARRAQ